MTELENERELQFVTGRLILPRITEKPELRSVEQYLWVPSGVDSGIACMKAGADVPEDKTYQVTINISELGSICAASFIINWNLSGRKGHANLFLRSYKDDKMETEDVEDYKNRYSKVLYEKSIEIESSDPDSYFAMAGDGEMAEAIKEMKELLPENYILLDERIYDPEDGFSEIGDTLSQIQNEIPSVEAQDS